MSSDKTKKAAYALFYKLEDGVTNFLVCESFQGIVLRESGSWDKDVINIEQKTNVDLKAEIDSYISKLSSSYPDIRPHRMGRNTFNLISKKRTFINLLGGQCELWRGEDYKQSLERELKEELFLNLDEETQTKLVNNIMSELSIYCDSISYKGLSIDKIIRVYLINFDNLGENTKEAFKTLNFSKVEPDESFSSIMAEKGEINKIEWLKADSFIYLINSKLKKFNSKNVLYDKIEEIKNKTKIQKTSEMNLEGDYYKKYLKYKLKYRALCNKIY